MFFFVFVLFFVLFVCFFSCMQCIKRLYFSGKKKKRNSTGQDLEGHSWDPGFDRVIVWDSGKIIGMRNFTEL